MHNEGAVFMCNEDRLQLLHLRAQHEDFLLQSLVHHFHLFCLLLQAFHPMLFLGTTTTGCSPGHKHKCVGMRVGTLQLACTRFSTPYLFLSRNFIRFTSGSSSSGFLPRFLQGQPHTIVKCMITSVRVDSWQSMYM